MKLLLGGAKTYQEVNDHLATIILGYRTDELDHALLYLQVVKREGDNLRLDIEMDDQFREYIEDLIEYGLIRYVIDNEDEMCLSVSLMKRMV